MVHAVVVVLVYVVVVEVVECVFFLFYEKLTICYLYAGKRFVYCDHDCDAS